MGRPNAARALLLVSLALLGCAESKEPGAEPTSTAEAMPGGSITVQGRVEVTAGLPMRGITVQVGTEVTTTADDGTFSVSGISLPYDLTFGTGDWVHQYQGLTTATPVVTTRRVAPPLAAARRGTIRGELLGLPGRSMAPGQFLQICAEGVDRVVYGCSRQEEGASYTLEVSWSGPPTVEVKLHALLAAVDVQRRIAGFDRQARGAAQVVDGGLTTLDLGFVEPPGAAKLEVSLSAPRELNSFRIMGFVKGDAGVMEAFESIDAQAERTVLPGSPADFGVFGVATGPTGASSYGWSPKVASGPVRLALSAVPTYVSPEAGAAVTVSTVFVAGASGGEARTFAFTFEHDRTILVSTLADRVRIPDVSTFGLAHRVPELLQWQLMGHPGIATSNAMAGGAGLFGLMHRLELHQGGPAPLEPGGLTTAAARPLRARVRERDTGVIEMPGIRGHAASNCP